MIGSSSACAGAGKARRDAIEIGVEAIDHRAVGKVGGWVPERETAWRPPRAKQRCSNDSRSQQRGEKAEHADRLARAR